VIAEDDVRRKIAEDLLTANADMQRALADDLRNCIDYAHRAGLSWRAIGKALGISHSAVFGHMKAGSAISVVRGHQATKEADEQRDLAERRRDGRIEDQPGRGAAPAGTAGAAGGSGGGGGG
jgi:hypothetical protein